MPIQIDLNAAMCGQESIAVTRWHVLTSRPDLSSADMHRDSGMVQCGTLKHAGRLCPARQAL